MRGGGGLGGWGGAVGGCSSPAWLDEKHSPPNKSCQKAATIAVDGVPYVDPKSKVLAVGEAGKSLARACQKLGVGLLTHHDLRDAFATAAIEAGVDIPTVAAWLGHADGGALLMRVYAHHRRAHSVSQAAKVVF